MTPRFAFKVHGNFAWPPLEPVGGQSASGTAAIVYVEENGSWSAFLQWQPRRSGASALPTPAEIANAPVLGQIDDGSLRLRVTDPREPFLFRLGPPTQPGPFFRGRRLLFRQAAFLDQFALDHSRDDAVGQRPVTRWKLASVFNIGNDRQFSDLFVGSPTDAASTGVSYGFNLALPSPAPQSVLVGPGQNDDVGSYALAFRAAFKPVLSTFPDKGLVPVDWIGEGSDAIELPAAMPAVIRRKWLGGFGLAKSDGGTTHVKLPRGSTDPGKYWLEHRRFYREDVLAPTFEVNAKLDEYFNFTVPPDLNPTPGNEGEFWNSVSFSDTNDASTQIQFRSTIALNSGSGPVSDGDLGIELSSGTPAFFWRDPLRIKRRIKTLTARLLVELELRYAIADKDIFAEIDSPGTLEAEVVSRFGFEARLPNTALSSDPNATVEPDRDVSWVHILSEAATAMARARLDLRNLDPAAPQSPLPEIALHSGTTRFAACARSPARFLKTPSSIGRGMHTLAWGRSSGLIEPSTYKTALTIWPHNKAIDIADNCEALPIELHFPSFFDRSATFHAKLYHDAHAEAASPCHFASFRLEVTKISRALARLGGLQFTTIDGPGGEFEQGLDSDYGYLRFSPRTLSVPPSDRLDTKPAYAATDVELRLRLSFSRVEPVGPDIAWGDRSGHPRPLLIGATPAAGTFGLVIQDAVSARGDRQLQAQIYALAGPSGESQAGSYVLLSERPFSLQRFSAPPLQARGSIDNTEVANYDSDDRTWRVKAIQQYYKYEFPPQVIGESMDRPRRLEISDRNSNRPRPHPPYAVNDDGTPRESDDVLRRTAVEIRFAPSSEIWVKPSDVERGYFLPEWASQELFRQSGAFGLGAAIAGFRGEFLYGLAVGIDPSLEDGPSRGARLAEIEALLGRPLPGARSANPDERLENRWNRVSDALARRPERLEMWMRDPTSTRPFIPARFERGARFALRDTAVFRSAFSPKTEAEDQSPPRIRKHGLPGGAFWPLESRNFERALRTRPESSGGSIDRIALSPLGGDADQRAEFLSGQLAIISETRNGRVHRHRVEIIGRIAALWHKAKHVVVYERATSPSAQFAPDDNSERSRRPILRKVSEYIELLEPTRAYPDFASASRQSSGSLRAIRFNAKIINVDSAWSEELGTYGYRLPLWNRESARQRPSVYPRPDLAFVTAAEGAGESEQPLVAQECLDPDNIFFFADASVGNADTDSWPSRIGVDCVNLPRPVHSSQARLAPIGEREANALRFPRGHRRFTWRLAPASRKTTINAERGDEPLYAGVETLTFMRASPADLVGTASAPNQDYNGVIADRLTRAAEPIVMPEAKFQPIAEARAGFEAALQIGELALVAQKAKKLRDALKGASVSDWSFADNGLFAALPGVDFVNPCAKIADDFVGSVQRRKLLLLEQVRDWVADQKNAVPAIGTQFGSYEELLGWFVGKIREAITPSLKTVQADLARVRSSVEKGRNALHELDGDIAALFADARAKRMAAIAAYDTSKPWSPARVEAYQRQLALIADGVKANINAANLEAQSRLATELDAVGTFAAEIGQVLHKAVEAADTGDAVLARATTVAALLIARIRGAIVKAVAAVGAAITELEKLDPQNQHANKVAALRTLLADFSRNATAGLVFLDDLQAKVDRGNVSLDQLLDQLRDNAQKLGTAVQALQIAAHAQIALFVEPVFNEARQAATDSVDSLVNDLKTALEFLKEVAGGAVDWLADTLNDRLATLEQASQKGVKEAFAKVDSLAALLIAKLNDIKAATSPAEVFTLIEQKVVRPGFESVLPPAEFEAFADITQTVAERLYQRVLGALVAIEAGLNDLDKLATGTLAEIQSSAKNLCEHVAPSLEALANQIPTYVADAVAAAQQLAQRINGALNDLEQLKQIGASLEDDLKGIKDGLTRSLAETHAYADRLFEEAGRLGSGGLAAAPNNILRLYAAAASAPVLPNLDFARERLGYYYDQLNNIIDTSPAAAWFGRLGDDLKAMGLSIPFDKIGDRLLPVDLSKFDIGKIFRNFGGLDLSKLFKGIRLPKGAGDTIKITHAFDKKQFRAWVQIEIDLPYPARKPLFALGPFELDFVNSRLVGNLRLEASKDADRVEQTGQASIETDIEAVVSGQTMVTLQKVVVRYDRASGLRVDLDPKNIRLNPTLRFIQDTLANLFPDEAGGLKIVKQNGIPIGVEHEFSMPPMSLMAGTSGVSNIQISNRFALIAYPDFVISNRFALSRPEMPFLFSIFIIGGTGYILVDCEYRPFRDELSVMVEAAAGGSAALGFAAGPVSGSVFVALSVALSYRKLVSGSGGGLTVSLVLLIAGTVDVAGLASAYMGLLLRMSYQDNGKIDGVGTLTMTIRISRFFKFSVRQHVQRNLRGATGSGGGARASLMPATTAGQRAQNAEARAEQILAVRG